MTEINLSTLLERVGVPNSQSWKLDGHCTRLPADWWFSTKPSELEAAAHACSTCPVREQCAEAGAGEKYGIWAGVDKDSVRAEKRRRKQRSYSLAACEKCGKERQVHYEKPAAVCADCNLGTHCKRGHERTPENTFNTSAGPRCRPCRNEDSRASGQRRRQLEAA